MSKTIRVFDSNISAMCVLLTPKSMLWRTEGVKPIIYLVQDQEFAPFARYITKCVDVGLTKLVSELIPDTAKFPPVSKANLCISVSPENPPRCIG